MTKMTPTVEQKSVFCSKSLILQQQLKQTGATEQTGRLENDCNFKGRAASRKANNIPVSFEPELPQPKRSRLTHLDQTLPALQGVTEALQHEAAAAVLLEGKRRVYDHLQRTNSPLIY